MEVSLLHVLNINMLGKKLVINKVDILSLIVKDTMDMASSVVGEKDTIYYMKDGVHLIKDFNPLLNRKIL